MRKAEIIARIADDRRVEKIVAEALAEPLPLHGDAADLAQIVYLDLLQKSETKIAGVWSQGEEAFNRYLAGMVMKSVTGVRSEYYRQIVRFSVHSRPINETDINTDADIWERRR